MAVGLVAEHCRLPVEIWIAVVAVALNAPASLVVVVPVVASLVAVALLVVDIDVGLLNVT